MRILITTLLISSTFFLRAQTARSSEADILKTDREFCAYALDHGFYKAMLIYAHDSIVKLNNGVLPIVGKQRLTKEYSDAEDTKAISWEPAGCTASASGDLGYTWGYWKFTLPDTVYYGNYVTVWKKENDKWKVLLDGGNDTPKPNR